MEEFSTGFIHQGLFTFQLPCQYFHSCTNNNLHCFCNADPGGRASRASSISVQCTSSQFFKLQASSTFIGEDKVVICISDRLEKTCNIVEIE